MKNILLTLVELLMFIPICVLIIGLIDFGLLLLMSWVANITILWSIVGLAISFYILANSIGVMGVCIGDIATYIVRNKSLAMASVATLAVINGAYAIYKIWNYDNSIIVIDTFLAIVGTLFYLLLTYQLLLTSSIWSKK